MRVYYLKLPLPLRRLFGKRNGVTYTVDNG